jgi:prepilin-type N-terminal cleavage/methylation domain-containing protein
MAVSQKKIKGFTLLELMVVLAIVSIVSAIGFPNFNSWRTDRAVRVTAVGLSNLFTEVYNHTQSSSYPFVQVLIDSRRDQDQITVRGYGILSDEYGDALFNNQSRRLACGVGDSLSIGNPNDDHVWREINMRPLRTTDVLFNFQDRVGVCFSKDTSHYQINAETSEYNDQFIILCPRLAMSAGGTDDAAVCNISDLQNNTIYPAYQLRWTRFGNINLFKYNHTNNDWNLQ